MLQFSFTSQSGHVFHILYLIMWSYNSVGRNCFKLVMSNFLSCLAIVLQHISTNVTSYELIHVSLTSIRLTNALTIDPFRRGFMMVRPNSNLEVEIQSPL
eukprot:TRINITY_DN15848_c0_g1_i1.p1 TRINITY_DN15848_c0_g1~~TRINITY_DN15848_c0_g1_i1.p1  ORF type:complete len:100 (-),score=5.89 TRINITY_DN15848_c0_g1_i1:2-301(-)